MIQYFDRQRLIWIRGGGLRYLHDDITEELYRIFNSLPQDHLCLFGNDGCIRGVASALRNELPHDRSNDVPALDGQGTRDLLGFACGTVLDFRTGQGRPCRPTDRISLCTGYAYGERETAPETK